MAKQVQVWQDVKGGFHKDEASAVAVDIHTLLSADGRGSADMATCSNLVRQASQVVDILNGFLYKHDEG